MRIRNIQPNHDAVYNRLKERQETQKQYHDRSARDLPPLVAGQPVHVQTPQGHWNPAIIQKQCEEPRSYIIKTASGKELRRNRKHIREAGDAVIDQKDNNKQSTLVPSSSDSSQATELQDSSKELPATASKTQTTPQITSEKTTRSGRIVRQPKRLNYC